MRDYSLQMRMIGHLRPLYPRVRFSLHAGELAPGLVPPEGLRSHVREAVEVAGASRIGHGVDVMHEDEPARAAAGDGAPGRAGGDRADQQRRDPGREGADHPLSAYMAAGVPVALATDDEGVSRSEMTMEYLRGRARAGAGLPAAQDHGAQLPGARLRGGREPVARAGAFEPVPACARGAGGMEGRRCREHVGRSAKARLQWELERAFGAFERAQAAESARAAAPAVR